MMFKRMLIVLTLATLLTSCATNGRGIKEATETKTVVIDTACKWVQPILISKKDVLTDGTARQILAHNETWSKNCEKQQQAYKQGRLRYSWAKTFEGFPL